jgi:hypothetical protein
LSVLPPVETKAKKVQAADIFDKSVKRSWSRGAAKQRTAVAPIAAIEAPSEESQKFWQSLLNATKSGESAGMDAIQYDRAAISLSQGKSYNVLTRREAKLTGDSARAAFTRAESTWGQFIPKFQDRVYQLSLGKAQLTVISAKDAGFDIVGHGHFFKLILQEGQVKRESVVWLTSDGVSVYPMPGVGR